MLCYVIFKEYFVLFDKEDVCVGVIIYKIVVYVVDLVKGYLGVQVCDNVLSKVWYEFWWKDQFDLLFDLECVFFYFYVGWYIDGEYCIMCGLNFCVM